MQGSRSAELAKHVPERAAVSIMYFFIGASTESTPHQHCDTIKYSYNSSKILLCNDEPILSANASRIYFVYM